MPVYARHTPCKQHEGSLILLPGKQAASVRNRDESTGTGNLLNCPLHRFNNSNISPNYHDHEQAIMHVPRFLMCITSLHQFRTKLRSSGSCLCQSTHLRTVNFRLVSGHTPLYDIIIIRGGLKATGTPACSPCLRSVMRGRAPLGALHRQDHNPSS